MTASMAYRRPWKSPLRSALCGVIAMSFAFAGAVVAAPAAHASGACAPDTNARGLASRPVEGSLVSVPRADGRVEQFQYFVDSSAGVSLPWFLWHRMQDEPGGDYGDWQRVSAVPIGPKISYVTAAESSDGRLEAFFPNYGVFCHTAQRTPDGDWSAPEDFGLNPSPYHGGVTFFREHDGSLDAFASSSRADSSMDVRSLRASSDTWGPVRSLGKVPDPNVGLSSPDTVTELPDGRLGLVVREWNRDRYWHITQLTPQGAWGSWQLPAA